MKQLIFKAALLLQIPNICFSIWLMTWVIKHFEITYGGYWFLIPTLSFALSCFVIALILDEVSPLNRD